MQQMMSRGGSVSLPLGLRALWILSMHIGAWGGLFSKLLNRLVTEEDIWSPSIVLGTPSCGADLCC